MSEPNGVHGGIVADEPRAAMVGQEILAAGGSAADAAVATYFALSVTMPSSAGLGGGGVCVVYDPVQNRAETIDFLPRPTSGGRLAVPLNIRGMTLLHARWGTARWPTLFVGAEKLARFGIQVSRALALDLSDDAALTRLDARSRSALMIGNGKGLPEGAKLVQPELADTLARLRIAGGADFYDGRIAQAMIDAGAELTLEDLRLTAPSVKPVLPVVVGTRTVGLPPPPSSGGAVAADMISMLASLGYDTADQKTRLHLLAEASRRAFAAEQRRATGEAAEIGTQRRAVELTADYQPTKANDGESVPLTAGSAPLSTGFAVLDQYGQSVACGFTLGGAFGTGQALQGLGFFTAPPPVSGALSIVPAVIFNTKNKSSYGAFFADGDISAPGAMATVLAELMMADRSVGTALRAPRLLTAGGGVEVEPGADDVVQTLQSFGHRAGIGQSIGHVAGAYCAAGLPNGGGACEVVTDTRGAGLAAAY